MCRSEVEVIGCRSALSLLGGRFGEDVCEKGAKVAMKLRVEVRSGRSQCGNMLRKGVALYSSRSLLSSN